jgi:hypothetical protein
MKPREKPARGEFTGGCSAARKSIRLDRRGANAAAVRERSLDMIVPFRADGR